MSFTLTYDTMLRHDIKHCYSGGRQKPVTSRDRSEGEKSFIELRRDKEIHQMKMNLITRTLADSRNPRDLPRAPAFSTLSRSEMDKVVERLRQPTVASKGIALQSEERVVADRLKSPRFAGERSLSSENLSASIDRLSTPTTASLLRQKQRSKEV